MSENNGAKSGDAKSGDKSVESPPKESTMSAAIRWYWAGMGTVGLAIGFFAGMSASPIVATLLPLLFGLLGGASGLFISRADTELKDTHFKTKALGVSFIFFSVPLLLSSVYGVLIRTQNPISELVPTFHSSEEVASFATIPEGESAKRMFEMVEVRARMVALGATKEEQKWVLRAMNDRRCQADLHDIRRRVFDISRNCRRIDKRLRKNLKEHYGETGSYRWETLMGAAKSMERAGLRQSFHPESVTDDLLWLEVDELGLFDKLGLIDGESASKELKRESASKELKRESENLRNEIAAIGKVAAGLRKEIEELYREDDPCLLEIGSYTFKSADEFIKILRSNNYQALAKDLDEDTVGEMAPHIAE